MLPELYGKVKLLLTIVWSNRFFKSIGTAESSLLINLERQILSVPCVNENQFGTCTFLLCKVKPIVVPTFNLLLA